MIKKETIQTALDIATPEQQLKISLLNQAMVENMEAYKAKFSTANLKAWKAAEKELEDFVDQVLADQDDGGSACETIPNINKVWTYLRRNGWKVGKTPSTLYNHIKQHRLKPDQSGKFPVPDVMDYARRYLKRLDGFSEGEEKDLRAKREAETRKARAQAAHWELKTKIDAGLYVPRDLFERELAARARIIKSDLLSFCRSTAPGIIALVHGDENLTPDLIDYMTEQVLICLDRYSRDTDPDKLIEDLSQ